jgi:hypothetical protein
MASFALTRVMVGTFRTTAEGVEEFATLLAPLRADIVPDAVLLVGIGNIDQRTALEGSIRAAFAQGIAKSHGPEERQPRQQAFDRSEAQQERRRRHRSG